MPIPTTSCGATSDSEPVCFDGDDRLRFGIDALIAGLEAVDRRG
jgi:hypothetical protein